MPNKNYVKGRRKEYAIVKKERERGRIAFRSAGSHSPVDVVSIDTANKKIRLIQSKPKTMGRRAKWHLEMENKELYGMFMVTFEVR